MRPIHRRTATLLIVLSLWAGGALQIAGRAQASPDRRVAPAAASLTTQAMAGPSPHPIVRSSARNDRTPPLRQMPPLPPVVGELFEVPRKTLPNRAANTPPLGMDPVLQEVPGGVSAPATGQNFEGLDNVNGVLPPDTNGDVGPNHYVQTVNLAFAIWDKSGNRLYGPANLNTLWQGFGGPCETTNNGDPIVLYDHLADRWLISQFALPNAGLFILGPFYQCLAISQSPDPTGAWYRYEFLISQTKLNDYPKFGVWGDGYYMSVNQFNQLFLDWGGQGVVAFERDQMLAGQPARMVYFDLYNTDPNLGGMLPADLDGTPPAAGTPNYFVQVDDNAWGYTAQDQLQVWQFQVNWSNPTSSTFTPLTNLATAAFDANLCNYGRNCIPQPGGTRVDAISDRLMNRLQYRNFGTHQTLVTNHTVDVDGNDHAGIRWYELRNSGGGWSVYQQGTYAPDADHRWMGSVALDGAGNLALGYSVSSGATYPSIRYTGRLAGDVPLGEMTQGEGTVVSGTGYQTHSSGRWGDYSMLAVDPTDGCTFWYTQEYYAVPGSVAGWQTRIGAFKFASCGSGSATPTATVTDTPLPPTPTPTDTPAPATATPTDTPTSAPTNTPSPVPTNTPTMTPGTGPAVSKIVLRVEQKGPNYQVLAEVYTDKGVLVEGEFSYNGTVLNTASSTVGGRGFARLESNRVQGAQGGDVFSLALTRPTSGVLTCSVSVAQGTNTCQ